MPAALVLLNVSQAAAHAVLLQAEPGTGARLSAAPSAVRLYFNERVEPVPNSIRVVNLKLERVDSGESRLIDQGQGIEVPLRALADGPYAVFWRIHSVDGHHVRGEYGFGLNDNPPDAQTISRLSSVPGDLLPAWHFPLVKWSSLLGLSMWLGGLSFLWTVLLPASRDGTGSGISPQHFFAAAARKLTPAILAGAAVFLIAEFFALAGHSATIADAGLRDAVAPAALAATLGATNYGHWWFVRISCAAVLLILSLLALRRRDTAMSPAWMPLAAALGAVVLVSIPMTGHARAVPHRVWVAVLSDSLHLAATAVWIGGLAALALLLAARRSAESVGALLGALARRFSTQAALCVLLLAATGIYNMWLHLPGWGALLSDDYGRMLLRKLVILAPLLAAAAVNRFRVLPALISRSGDGAVARAAQRLRTLVRIEVLLGVVILGIVGMLTQLSPSAAGSGGAGPLTKRVGDFVISLELPQQTGSNRAVVWLRNSHGDVLADARRVQLYVTMLEMDMGLQTVPAALSPDGSYTADVMLSMAGRWRISVEVTPARGDTFLTEFDFLAAPQGNTEGSRESAP